MYLRSGGPCRRSRLGIGSGLPCLDQASLACTTCRAGLDPRVTCRQTTSRSARIRRRALVRGVHGQGGRVGQVPVVDAFVTPLDELVVLVVPRTELSWACWDCNKESAVSMAVNCASIIVV